MAVRRGGLAVGVGYAVAGLGPLLMGVLVDLRRFTAAILVLLATSVGVAARHRPDRRPTRATSTDKGNVKDGKEKAT